MKLRLCCLALALCAFAPAAFADLAPPPPTPTATAQTGRRAAPLPTARMSIESRRDATEARLQIPRSMLRQLRAGMDGEDAAVAAGSLDATRTIIAGVFLSLSLAFAGIFIARTRSRAAKQAAVVALVVFVVAGAFAVKTLANIRPLERLPLDAGSLNRATQPDAELSGLIRVELVPEDGAVKLIVPASPKREGE